MPEVLCAGYGPHPSSRGVGMVSAHLALLHLATKRLLRGPGLCGRRIACHGARRAAVTVGTARDVIRDKGAALAHGFRTACGCVHRSLELELSVYFSAKKNDVKGDIEPQ